MDLRALPSSSLSQFPSFTSGEIATGSSAVETSSTFGSSIPIVGNIGSGTSLQFSASETPLSVFPSSLTSDVGSVSSSLVIVSSTVILTVESQTSEPVFSSTASLTNTALLETSVETLSSIPELNSSSEGTLPNTGGSQAISSTESLVISSTINPESQSTFLQTTSDSEVSNVSTEQILPSTESPEVISTTQSLSSAILPSTGPATEAPSSTQGIPSVATSTQLGEFSLAMSSSQTAEIYSSIQQGLSSTALIDSSQPAVSSELIGTASSEILSASASVTTTSLESTVISTVISSSAPDFGSESGSIAISSTTDILGSIAPSLSASASASQIDSASSASLVFSGSESTTILTSEFNLQSTASSTIPNESELPVASSTEGLLSTFVSSTSQTRFEENASSGSFPSSTLSSGSPPTFESLSSAGESETGIPPINNVASGSTSTSTAFETTFPASGSQISSTEPLSVASSTQDLSGSNGIPLSTSTNPSLSTLESEISSSTESVLSSEFPSMTIFSSASLSSTTLSSASASATSSFDYIGCSTNSTGTLDGPTTYSSDMTPAICSTICSEYEYYAVESGVKCVCGNNIETGGILSGANCTTTCGDGNGTLSCSSASASASASSLVTMLRPRKIAATGRYPRRW
ncbi:hypothetical protein BofuT4_P039450.1 [Botrytis cinerea T4]|uniref:WSC domain-containing protein n=1 Tax=Botryotinia fuckeliana (strain T4) TaxID=999810 RepID=G2Y303_BOTF4|nr:hypothetical protein BofuT4_P039450.1 [Botrytis cinerea T4]